MRRIELPLEKPRPDIEKFCGVIRREIVPERPPLSELIVDGGVMQKLLPAQWPDGLPREGPPEKYLPGAVNFFFRFGYDYVRVSGGIEFERKRRISGDGREWSEEGSGVITNRREYEEYPWPEPRSYDISHYEYVSKILPGGMGMFVCPSSGFLEIPLNHLMGYEALSYALYDDPGLVKDVIDRTGALIYGLYEKLASLDRVYGFFQGDDMGFKTGTLLSPSFLREYILPWHKKLAGLAHENGLLYLLHSCGNLEEIMEDLVEDVGIDALHSFEDAIMPVADFKKK